MANEITVNVFAQCVNSGYQSQFNPTAVQITQATVGADSGILDVTTGGVNLPNTNTAGNEGILCLKNLDGTNYVTWGPLVSGTQHDLGRLFPNGAPVLLQLKPGVTVKLTANVATCKVQYEIWRA